MRDETLGVATVLLLDCGLLHWKFCNIFLESVVVVVSALEFRSEGRWFDTKSLPSCCFLRQDTLPHIVALHPGVEMGTGDILLVGNPAMD